MVLNRSHIPWFLLTLVATGVAWALYLANFFPARMPYFTLPAIFGPAPPLRNTVGGTPLGLLFGTISYLIFLIAAGLGIRKKRRLWPIGHVQLWMKLHIWLTLLTIPLILFHCGFHFGGLMTTGLMVLYAIVMVSGIYGLALQQFMPGLMTRRLPQEAVFEAIPHVRDELLQAADKLWAELAPAPRAHGVTEIRPGTVPHAQLGGHFAGALVAPTAEAEDEAYSRRTVSEFMHDTCFPFLRMELGGRHRLSNQRAAEDAFRTLQLNVSANWQPQVKMMEQWCYDRRLLDAQTRMHHWLHLWLLVHVPLSFILLVVTFWHAYVTITYL